MDVSTGMTRIKLNNIENTGSIKVNEYNTNNNIEITTGERHTTQKDELQNHENDIKVDMHKSAGIEWNGTAHNLQFYPGKHKCQQQIKPLKDTTDHVNGHSETVKGLRTISMTRH